LRKRTTNVAADDSALFAQFPERPFEIRNFKPATFPICDRIIRPKTIEIDRNINISLAEIGNEHFEMSAPIFLQDRTATLSIFNRPVISPGMDFKSAYALGAAVGKNIVRPPALEISASPNGDVLDVRELKGAIDPAAAAPFRRTHVPVRMIIKRNQNDWLTQPTKPKRTEIMEIARAIENKRRNLLSEFAVEFLD
jgi:hypothetical protein